MAKMVTVLESCRVSPPAQSKAEKRLPLTFFDLIWIPFHPLGRVIFFDFPCSTDHFIQHIVPILKTSLSHSLQHFLPMAGNLIKPSNSNSETDLYIRYVDGDSVSVTFAECRDDFNHFCGYEARAADLLSPLVSQLPTGVTHVEVSGEKCSASPLLAIQVTLFPNHGVCFGFTNSHVVGDGSSVFSFVHAWASLAKQAMLKEDDGLNFRIPCYDRSLIKDPFGLGAKLLSHLGGSAMADQMEEIFPDKSAGDNTKSRVTFVLKQADIEALKRLVIQKRPSLQYVSSFTVTCAYVWTCMAKTRAAVVKHLEREPLNFGIAYDCRARLDPPLPASYFGNCILSSIIVENKETLAGEEGLFTAAELIGKSLFAKLNNKEGVFNGASNFEDEFAGVLRGEWYLGVAGSPKLDYYNTIDFGWGKPRKFEFVSEPFSISRCKDSKVGLELGFIMPNDEVDVFSSIFAQGLRVPT